jgi:8-oxo-dGTP pyrophosphatase MutT (NUDIX family)
VAACAGVSERTVWQPTRYERGPRVGATAALRIGASAAVLDGDRLLLTRRSDNGEWCLPGGGVDPGERPSETATREVLEETGLTIRVTGLLGVYSDPDLVVVYPDGNRVQIIASCYWAEPVAGEAGLSDEVTGVGWFSAAEADELTVIPTHRNLLDVVFGRRDAPYWD